MWSKRSWIAIRLILFIKNVLLTVAIKKVRFLVAKLKESLAFEETALLCFTISSKSFKISTRCKKYNLL